MDDLKITLNIGPDAVKAFFKRLAKPGKLFKIAVLLFFLSHVIGYSLTRTINLPHSWKDGDEIVAQQFNENFNILFEAVNLLIGNTENAGIPWFEEKFNTIFTKINADILDNENLFGALPVSGTALPTGLVVYFNKDVSTDINLLPLNWTWYNDGSRNAQDMFLVPVGGVHIINSTNSNTTHDHIIDHTHTLISVELAGAHNHGVFNLNKYRPLSLFGSLVDPWHWEVYNSDGVTTTQLGGSSFNNEDAYSFGGISSGTQYYPLRVDLTADTGFLSQSDFFRFYTNRYQGHTHNATDGSDLSSKTSGTADNIPPYHVLHLIQKN